MLGQNSFAKSYLRLDLLRLDAFGVSFGYFGLRIASCMQDELRDATILVFANKQDLPNAMSVAEITDKLGLHSLRQRRW